MNVLFVLILLVKISFHESILLVLIVFYRLKSLFAHTVELRTQTKVFLLFESMECLLQ